MNEGLKLVDSSGKVLPELNTERISDIVQQARAITYLVLSAMEPNGSHGSDAQRVSLTAAHDLLDEAHGLLFDHTVQL